ncbi:MAG: serine/threonine protein kinase [Planctomycetota bacterium]|nr:MAG: serine/threonine protein kinase [Planctomycetota bacterium]
MPTKADQILVELAVRNHLISEAEGADCLAVAAREGVEVGQVMLRRQLVKERHLQSLQRKQRKLLAEHPEAAQQAVAAAASLASAPTQVDVGSDATVVAPGPDSPLLSAQGAMVLFGQIAVSQGLVTPADLERALRLQEQLAAQNNPMRIGEILVRARRLSPEQVRGVLEYQEKWIYKCAVCGRRFNVSVSQQDLSLRCAACGGELLRGCSSSIAVEATHAASQDGAPLAPLLPSGSRPTSEERKPPTPEDPAGLVGLTWKGYRVEKVLGKGGMGAVYLATQIALRRKVALKVMLRIGGRAHPGERERFEREAKLLAGLNHPNIVGVINAEWDEDLGWFTMELVEGQDLKAALRSGRFPIGKGAEVVAKCARAMDFAHKKGIIHRDLKPQNIMIEAESGEPKILDFGLAKNVDAEQLEQLTQMGAFLGTPAYMAPEQAGGDPTKIDGRADVYALGAILYEVLTGRPPFTGKKAIQVIRKVLKEDPLSCRRIFPQADPRLEAIALKALRKDPAQRQQTAGELADEIEAVIGRVTRSFERAASTEGEAQDSGAGKRGFFGRLFGG